MKRFSMILAVVGALAGCGGGGGSGWLQLPSSVDAKIYQGEGIRLRVTGTAKSAPTSRINIGVFAVGDMFVEGSQAYELDEQAGRRRWTSSWAGPPPTSPSTT